MGIKHNHHQLTRRDREMKILGLEQDDRGQWEWTVRREYADDQTMNQTVDYRTNVAGDGLFVKTRQGGDWMQASGTCQFSLSRYSGGISNVNACREYIRRRLDY